jgi:hypothetical protein
VDGDPDAEPVQRRTCTRCGSTPPSWRSVDYAPDFRGGVATSLPWETRFASRSRFRLDRVPTRRGERLTIVIRYSARPRKGLFFIDPGRGLSDETGPDLVTG